MAHPYRGDERAAASQGKEQRSLQELFAELSDEAATLVRQEINLARIELGRKAALFGRDLGLLMAGVAVLFAGLLAIIAAIIIALSHAMAWWLATLLFALVILGIASFFAWTGLSHLDEQASPMPDALPVREGSGA